MAAAPTQRVRRAACTSATCRTPLKDSFANYGAVSSEIAVDRETGRSRGFGFVSFQDSKSASDAIQGMNGQDIGGRNVTVQEAQPHSRR
uniref:RRM domain-containing protein n=1 Tax=Oryza punctata TaxID=4537 RepID=A0A0E0KZX0_ORYPU